MVGWWGGIDTLYDETGSGEILVDGQSLNDIDFTAIAPNQWSNGEIHLYLTDSELLLYIHIFRREEFLAGHTGTVSDEAGDGLLVVDGETLTGSNFTAFAANQWRSGDGTGDLVLLLTDEANGPQLSLVMFDETGTQASGGVAITGFVNGNFGLDLPVYNPDPDDGGDSDNLGNRSPEAHLRLLTFFTQGQTFFRTKLPVGMFSDSDNNPLAWSLTLENGDPLLGWLNLELGTHHFCN